MDEKKIKMDKNDRITYLVMLSIFILAVVVGIFWNIPVGIILLCISALGFFGLMQKLWHKEIYEGKNEKEK